MRCDVTQSERITRLFEPSSTTIDTNIQSEPNQNETDDEWTTVSPMIFVPNQLVGAPSGTDVTIDCNTEAHPKYIKNPFYIIFCFFILAAFRFVSIFVMYVRMYMKSYVFVPFIFIDLFVMYHFAVYWLLQSSCNITFVWILLICWSNKENEQTTVQQHQHQHQHKHFDIDIQSFSCDIN